MIRRDSCWRQRRRLREDDCRLMSLSAVQWSWSVDNYFGRGYLSCAWIRGMMLTVNFESSRPCSKHSDEALKGEGVVVVRLMVHDLAQLSCRRYFEHHTQIRFGVGSACLDVQAQQIGLW